MLRTLITDGASMSKRLDEVWDEAEKRPGRKIDYLAFRSDLVAVLTLAEQEHISSDAAVIAIDELQAAHFGCGSVYCID